MAPRGCGPASHTPPPSTGDEENKDAMRAVVAAASAALAAPRDTGEQPKPAAQDARHAVASPEDCYNSFMAYASMRHHSEVARLQAQAQLAADAPLSPPPETLPFPSFLTQSQTPEGAGSSPAGSQAAASGSLRGSVPRNTAAPPASKTPTRPPTARAGSKRPVINPGSGSQPFTSERARAAAAKRWSSAAARRRGKGVLSLKSLPGALSQSPLSTTAGSTMEGASGGGAAAASAGLIALSAQSTGAAPSTAAAPAAMAPTPAVETTAVDAVAAANHVAALAAAKAVAKAKTAATTKASMASKNAKVAGGETLDGGKTVGGKTVVGRKAVGGRKQTRGGRAAVGADAVEVVDVEEDVATLKREVAELWKLKTQLENLAATVGLNTELLGTHGHSMDLLAASFTDMKHELRQTCKPAPPPFRRSDKDDDDDKEKPPAPKRVRFAVATTVVPPVQSPPPPPPPPSPFPMAQLPADDEVPPLEDQTPLQQARFEVVDRVMGANTTGPRSRLRRPTARVCDVETRADEQARRRAEGTVVMQGIRDLLNPRVSRLIALATVSRDVLLDPETKFEMIVDNATEYMGVSAEEANVFLLEMIDQPTKKRTRGGFKPKAVRACAPLGMVFSHVMWGIKAVVVAAWFCAVNSSVSSMTVEQAVEWKTNRRYGQSDVGRVGIIAASRKMFIHLNVRHRIKEPTESGQVVVVHKTAGHYGLICTFVAEALEALVTGVKSGGPDGDRFKRYVAEMISLDDYLPKDNGEHNGLVIVDGADPNRSNFPIEYMPVPSDGVDDIVGAAGVAA